MEKKVKIELPSKYRVGIQILVPMITRQMMNACRSLVDAIADIMGNGIDGNFADTFETDGKAIVSIPLIHSIAETKMDGLNELFEHSGMPFKAYLEKEEQ